MEFNPNANLELTALLKQNARVLKDHVVEDILEFTDATKDEIYPQINFTGTAHASHTKTWYEFTTHQEFTCWATFNEDGFSVVVLDPDEFEDY